MDQLNNPVVILAFVAWFITQSIKYVLNRSRDSEAKFSDPGGMPSSHAAVVGAAATVIGLDTGLDSDVFGLALVVAAIVVHDAYRVRWAVGEQARRLNDLLAVSSLADKSPVVVWKGHRMRELAVGLLLGVGISWGFYAWLYA